MSGITVTNIPNTPENRAVYRDHAGHMKCRLRGRGVPAGEPWQNYQWQTPIRVAPRFTAYYGNAPYVRFDHIGITADDKPHVLLLGASE